MRTRLALLLLLLAACQPVPLVDLSPEELLQALEPPPDRPHILTDTGPQSFWDAVCAGSADPACLDRKAPQ